MISLVQLRRSNTSQSWGFRLNGGTEFKQPLFIQKVTPGSIAHRSGLRPGDVVREIARVSTHSMSHQQAKMEIIRAGNEIDFFVERNGMPLTALEDVSPASPPINYATLPQSPPEASGATAATYGSYHVAMTSSPHNAVPSAGQTAVEPSPAQTYIAHRSLTLR